MEKNVICGASGKSGGHIIPNLTLAHKNPASILYFSGDSKLDHLLLDNTVEWHIPLTLSLKPLWKAPFRFIKAIAQSFYYLIKYKPTVIISTGGIIAVPVCIAAFFLRIPINVYELNAVPGKAIKFLAPLATHIFVCFKETQKYFKNSTIVTYPIRFAANLKPQPLSHFSPSRKTILILGGSQGSQSLNSIWKQVIETQPSIAQNIQVIHQFGNNDASWDIFYATHKIPAITFAFSNHIETLYPHADLVICRAGAGSLFETLHFKKQCIAVPLETSATSHQLDNALAIQKDHPSLFTVMREQNLKKSVWDIIKFIETLP